MDRELKMAVKAALLNQPSNNFSAEDVNQSVINSIMDACGLTADSTPREIRAKEEMAFALIEEAVDEVLPAKIQNLFGAFAEVKTFARDAEVVFNIEKIGKNRAKLTIAKGARGGIYRAARTASKTFGVNTEVQTVAVYVTLEELILGTASLAEFFNNILEGFEEIIFKDIYNALAAGSTIGYKGDANKQFSSSIQSTSAALTQALDDVLPIVKQYGTPTIFGSYKELQKIYNPLATTVAGYPNLMDSADIRNNGFVQVYKGVNVVELPNYLVDEKNDEWFYNENYIFVIPSGIKPVKVALKGDMTIIKNTQAVGSEKWEASKMVGVGVAMSNNYAVIKVAA